MLSDSCLSALSVRLWRWCIVATKRLDGSRCHLGIGLGPGHIVRWGPSFPTERGSAATTFRPMSILAKRSPISATAELLFIRTLRDDPTVVDAVVLVHATLQRRSYFGNPTSFSMAKCPKFHLGVSDGNLVQPYSAAHQKSKTNLSSTDEWNFEEV